ncbi:MAG TPA: tetratricopeptide repeat protein, partial [Verrucomicrobiae bacterium]|nr:tetratricopeptide repeat protein [Verrucomicrobiae bacterium]
FARASQGDLQSAITLLKRAIAARPHMANLHFQVAQIQIQLGDREAAIKSLDEGLQYAPDDQRARLMLRQLRTAAP